MSVERYRGERRQPAIERTLMQQGYVIQDEASEQYRIGTRLVALGRAVSENFDLVRLAGGPMAHLRDQVGQSAVMSARTRGGEPSPGSP